MTFYQARNRIRPGFTLVEMLVCIGIITILLALILPAVQRIREAANKTVCANNLKQIGIALALYHTDYGRLPPGCTSSISSDNMPHIGWTTRITPYLEKDELWSNATKAFKQNPDFLSTPHRNVSSSIITLYTCPSDGRTNRDDNPKMGYTHYLGIEGTDYITRNGTLYLDSKISYRDINDGLSNTIIVGERPPSLDGAWGWWYAGWGQNKDGSGEMVLGVRELNSKSVPQSEGLPSGPYHFQPGGRAGDMFYFWSKHPNGANFLTADGGTHFLLYSSDKVIGELATRSGHEVVTIEE